MTTLACIIMHFFTLILAYPASNIDNTVEVIDTVPERSAKVRQIVEFYLNHFEIKNQKVVIFMSPDMPRRYRAHLVAAVHNEHGDLRFTHIKVDNKLKGYWLAKVIGHEIYHIKQMVDKRLYFEDNQSAVKWQGKTFRHVEAIPYEKRPWEEECLLLEYSFAPAYLKFRKENQKPTELKVQEKTENMITKITHYSGVNIQHIFKE